MNHYVDYITDQLKSLTSIPSPTGFTKDVTAYVHKTLTDLGYQPTFSHKGNVHVTLGGEGNPIVLAAHLDTLGAMVRTIKDSGRIRPTTVGGHQWATCDGENCTVHTRDGRVYTGVILNVEPSSHVRDREVPAVEKNMEILLDENVNSKDDVLALGIQTGDFIALDPRTTVTPSGYIKSRYLDDKLSASILLGFAKYVKENDVKLNRKVSLVFTVFEEIGHGGSVLPEDTAEMLVVDMGCVGDDLECTEREVSICAKDGSGPYHYDVTTALINLAKEENIGYAVDVYPFYSSDASAALRSGHDIHFGLIGPGVYASHNYERSHVDGVRNTFNLIKAYVTK